MAYEKRPNSGTLGKNKRKTEDKHPEYSGQINVDGKDYWLSAWVKTGPDGSKFFSLAVKPKEARAETPKAAPVYKGAADDDSIPF